MKMQADNTDTENEHQCRQSTEQNSCNLKLGAATQCILLYNTSYQWNVLICLKHYIF